MAKTSMMSSGKNEGSRVRVEAPKEVECPLCHGTDHWVLYTTPMLEHGMRRVNLKCVCGAVLFYDEKVIAR